MSTTYKLNNTSGSDVTFGVIVIPTATTHLITPHEIRGSGDAVITDNAQYSTLNQLITAGTLTVLRDDIALDHTSATYMAQEWLKYYKDSSGGTTYDEYVEEHIITDTDAHVGSQIANDSSVAGTTINDAIETVNASIDHKVIGSDGGTTIGYLNEVLTVSDGLQLQTQVGTGIINIAAPTLPDIADKVDGITVTTFAELEAALLGDVATIVIEGEINVLPQTAGGEPYEIVIDSVSKTVKGKLTFKADVADILTGYNALYFFNSLVNDSLTLSLDEVYCENIGDKTEAYQTIFTQAPTFPFSVSINKLVTVDSDPDGDINLTSINNLSSNIGNQAISSTMIKTALTGAEPSFGKYAWSHGAVIDKSSNPTDTTAYLQSMLDSGVCVIKPHAAGVPFTGAITFGGFDYLFDNGTYDNYAIGIDTHLLDVVLNKASDNYYPGTLTFKGNYTLTNTFTNNVSGGFPCTFHNTVNVQGDLTITNNAVGAAIFINHIRAANPVTITLDGTATDCIFYQSKDSNVTIVDGTSTGSQLDWLPDTDGWKTAYDGVYDGSSGWGHIIGKSDSINGLAPNAMGGIFRVTLTQVDAATQLIPSTVSATFGVSSQGVFNTGSFAYPPRVNWITNNFLPENLSSCLAGVWIITNDTSPVSNYSYISVQPESTTYLTNIKVEYLSTHNWVQATTMDTAVGFSAHLVTKDSNDVMGTYSYSGGTVSGAYTVHYGLGQHHIISSISGTVTLTANGFPAAGTVILQITKAAGSTVSSFGGTELISSADSGVFEITIINNLFSKGVQVYA